MSTVKSVNNLDTRKTAESDRSVRGKKKKTAQEERVEEKEKEAERNKVNQTEQSADKTKITNVPDDDKIEDADQEQTDPL